MATIPPLPKWEKDLFESLPTEYAELAIPRVKTVGGNSAFWTVAQCIIWNKTPEGEDFWLGVCCYLADKEKYNSLPPIPSNRGS